MRCGFYRSYTFEKADIFAYTTSDSRSLKRRDGREAPRLAESAGKVRADRTLVQIGWVAQTENGLALLLGAGGPTIYSIQKLSDAVGKTQLRLERERRNRHHPWPPRRPIDRPQERLTVR